MSVVHSRAFKSAGFVTALLLSTAISAPAFAEIEEVVVTAQKTSQDIQTVPIAVSAFTSSDLAAHQIVGFKDLQFSTPSVHFTHGNFGPSNFQIRGIGSAAVATSGDPGVSVNYNDVYLSNPPLTAATYYDVQRIEVLRGPQSTLYGRNATGGAINVISNKPNLEDFGADLEATYGNYNDIELRGAINIPIVTDQLGVRLAGFWLKRDGTIDNIYPALHPGSGVASKIDSRDQYAMRGSIRWQPSNRTTIDLIGEVSHASDTRVRAQVTRCHTDPSGVLGCLPDSLAAEPVNANAGLSRTFASDIGPLAGTPFQLYTVSGATPDPTITDPVGQQIPNSLEAVNTDFTPLSHGHSIFTMLEWKQDLFSWLNADLLLGYVENGGRSQQAYTTSPGADYASFAPYPAQAFLCGLFLPPGTDCSSRVAAAQNLFGALVAPTNYAAYFAGHIGTLPVSSVLNNGTTGLSIAKYTNHDSSFDEISGNDHEVNAELRFQSSFDGPVNFLLGLYHLNYSNFNVQYFVNNSGAFDYPGIILGPLVAADGYVLSPTQFNSNNRKYQLTSNAVFGEVYWTAIPDTLKFTVGARYTNDNKSFLSKSIALSFPQAIGTTTPPSVNSNCLVAGAVCTADGFLVQRTNYNAWTGRAVVDWTPQLDFTTQTLVYASYSRGYRSGGFNPPASVPGLFPQAFAPETVDAFEVGTKNTLPLLSGTLQANADFWYYNYKGYQVSSIINRQSVNTNIDAKLWGVEGQFFYAPDDNWQFNLNFGYTDSEIGNTRQLDTRTPTDGQPGWTLLKDNLGANCAIYNTGGGAAPTPATPGFASMIAAPPAQPGASVAEYAGFLTGGASCSSLNTAWMAYQAGLGPDPLPAGYAYSNGYLVSLNGNQMPSTPPWTVSVGVQYTFHFDGGYTLVPRIDYYWNDSSWGTIFNDGADRLKAWDVANAQIQLNSPDSLWYARAWVQNLADKHNVTGMYVTDPSSGLFSNLFVGSPRTYGITLGIHM